jgi:hypothetical protein
MLPPDSFASPVGLARRIAQIAVPRSPAARPGISYQAKAAAMAAHLGGKSATYLRGVEVPGTYVDAVAAYSVVGALLGTGTWLQAELIEQRLLTPGRGLAGFLSEFASLDVDALLRHPQRWPMLAGVALVQPCGDIFAVRGRSPGENEDRTTTTEIAGASEPIWQMLPRVKASELLTGRMPEVLKLYTWHPQGIVPGCRAVELPGGILFSPTQKRRRVGNSFNDLSLALAEIGLLAKAGRLDGVDEFASTRLGPGFKVERNGVAYGGPVQFDRSRSRHPAWGPFGKLSQDIYEEPGWLADPPVGALATAGCELLLTLLEILVGPAGDSVAWVDTDAAFVLTPKNGETIGIEGRGREGGPISQEVPTVTPKRLVRILNRFGPIAASTKLSIPAYSLYPEPDGYRLVEKAPPANLYSVFKISSENFRQDGIWALDTSCYATAQKRYVLKRETEDGAVQAKSSAFVLGTLANFREDGALSWERIEEAWRLGPGLAEGGKVFSLVLDLSEPVLQPLVLAHPKDWRALGGLRFSSENPDGIRPFETVLVPVPHGTPRGRLVAYYEPDRSSYKDLVFQSPEGTRYVVRTADSLSRPGPKGARVQVVPSLGEWLTDYFTHPEPLSLGPDGKSCGPNTRGVLSTHPVRIVKTKVGGQEPHRRRDEEAVSGWDVQVGQEILSAVCRAPACRKTLSGRQRNWCERHKTHPGARRRAWKEGG